MVGFPESYRSPRSWIACALILLSSCGVRQSLYGEESAEFGRELPKSERVAILDMLAKKMSDNYEQIKTWRGCYHFVDARFLSDTNQSLRENQKNPSTYDELYSPVMLSGEIVRPLQLNKETRRGYWIVHEGKIDFVFDSQTQREYVRELREPRIDFIDIPTGLQVRRNSGPGPYYYIYAPDRATHLDTHTRIGPITGHAIVDGVPEGRLVSVRPLKNAVLSSFNCRALFGGEFDVRVSTEPGFWSSLTMRSDALSGKATGGTLDAETVRSYWDLRVKIYVSGDSDPIYTVIVGDQSKGHSVMRFDSKSGFNWIWHTHRNGEKTAISQNATYRRVNGVYILESFEVRRVEKGATDPYFIRRMKLEDTILNAAVSDSDFSVYQFDLKYCDRMLDEIKDELHVYDDLMKKFVVAENFSFDATRPRE